jgi:DNA-3-methyladenine glycosylase II
MKMNLKPAPPYDFDLSAAIFSGGDGEIRQYANNIFHQVIQVDKQLILISVQSVGTVNNPKLEIDLTSDTKIEARTPSRAEEIIGSILNLKLDLMSFYETAKKDKVLSLITQELRGLKSPITPTVFEALVDSIIEQQISLTVAHVLQNRLIKFFGGVLRIGQQKYYAYPGPEALASASIDELRKCGLSARKAEYVQGISRLITGGQLNLEKFKTYKDSEKIIEEMDQIRGIGLWTSELTLIRGIGKLDVIPADDLGLKKIIGHYYFEDARILSQDARLVADKWDGWKGLASFYLVMATIKGIEVK